MLLQLSMEKDCDGLGKYGETYRSRLNEVEYAK